MTELEQAVDFQIKYETLSLKAKDTDACKKAFPYTKPKKFDPNHASIKACNADKDCVFCVSGAVPSECKSVVDGKKLHGGAFKCVKWSMISYLTILKLKNVNLQNKNLNTTIILFYFFNSNRLIS